MPSSPWTAANLPDLSGRTAVVTGASSGIGLVTARELARAGARVTLAVRDADKGGRAAAAMAGQPEVRSLDVSSLASIVTISSQLHTRGRIHLGDLNGDHRGTARCRPTATPSSPSSCSPRNCNAG